MNFHLGKSMNCRMRLGFSETTCPQRLQEQNLVKVIFVLYDSEPNHSCSRLCPLFLLVDDDDNNIGNGPTDFTSTPPLTPIHESCLPPLQGGSVESTNNPKLEPMETDTTKSTRSTHSILLVENHLFATI
jgi:hypothetical protein